MPAVARVVETVNRAVTIHLAFVTVSLLQRSIAVVVAFLSIISMCCFLLLTSVYELNAHRAHRHHHPQ